MLINNEKLLIQLSGYDRTRFEALYRDFEEAWQALEAERPSYSRRQISRGAGRKYIYNKREQLLFVLLWAHLRLHPQIISHLLCVHVSTFARIRQRVLTVLHRLNVSIDLPDRTSYQDVKQLTDITP